MLGKKLLNQLEVIWWNNSSFLVQKSWIFWAKKSEKGELLSKKFVNFEFSKKSLKNARILVLQLKRVLFEGFFREIEIFPRKPVQKSEILWKNSILLCGSVTIVFCFCGVAACFLSQNSWLTIERSHWSTWPSLSYSKGLRSQINQFELFRLTSLPNWSTLSYSNGFPYQID